MSTVPRRLVPRSISIRTTVFEAAACATGGCSAPIHTATAATTGIECHDLIVQYLLRCASRIHFFWPLTSGRSQTVKNAIEPVRPKQAGTRIGANDSLTIALGGRLIAALPPWAILNHQRNRKPVIALAAHRLNGRGAHAAFDGKDL